jgi:LacI family transcriptional regulator
MVQERESTSLMTMSDPYARVIVNLIDEKYAENLKMSELLQSVPLSRRSIEMRFKKATGYTIYQYLLKVRVDHMAHCLLTTDRSYLDIAYEVGFHDLANVSRTFKKFKGCSPQEYLRKYCDI